MVVDYLKPSCAACRRLYPKLLQIAKSNPDALFIKVRTSSSARLLRPEDSAVEGGLPPARRVSGGGGRPPLLTPFPFPPIARQQVNVETPEMRELGRGMNVTHLPWFHMFRGGDLIASFSANVTTVSTLRAEIAANKACVDPGCSVY